MPPPRPPAPPSSARSPLVAPSPPLPPRLLFCITRRALILNSPFFLQCRCNYAENRSPIRRCALRRRAMLILEHRRIRARARVATCAHILPSSSFFFSMCVCVCVFFFSFFVEAANRADRAPMTIVHFDRATTARLFNPCSIAGIKTPVDAVGRERSFCVTVNYTALRQRREGRGAGRDFCFAGEMRLI